MPRFKANSQELISLVVEDVVEQCGSREAALPDLLKTVHYMWAIALDDAENRQKGLELERWFKAVRALCNPPQALEKLVSGEDLRPAHEMGIRLD